ncbi:zinc finger protein 567 [Aplysia californica]|uniref:Zinc finger protein 567 n=1 Tax=Aplysia californica TaxID=6500 RepID=A0ABM0K1H8_APLCA|nr:zinc finger protein 567 [Aplysia californica]
MQTDSHHAMPLRDAGDLCAETDGKECIQDNIMDDDSVDDQTSTSLFDIFSPPSSINPSFSSILDDIDLDLECEEDEDVYQDSINNFMLDAIGEKSGQEKGTGNIQPVNEKEQDSTLLQPENGMHEQDQLDRLSDGAVQFRISVPIIEMKDKMIMKCYLEKLNGLSQEQAQISQTQRCNTSEVNKETCNETGISSSIETEEVRILCHKCQVPFSSLQALFSHNQDKHIVKKESSEFVCPMCREICKSSVAMAKHCRLHCFPPPREPDVPEKRFEWHFCEVCPYKAKTKALLTLHVKTKHNPDRKIYVCDICKFSCLQERTYVIHKRRHEGEGKFACDQCGKLFMSMSILKRHVITHNKSKPYICPIPECGKAFTIKSRLGDHLRTVRHRNNFKDSKAAVSLPLSLESKMTDDLSLTKWNLSQRDTGTDLSKGEPYEICVYDIVLPENETLERKEETVVTAPGPGISEVTTWRSSLCSPKEITTGTVHEKSENKTPPDNCNSKKRTPGIPQNSVLHYNPSVPPSKVSQSVKKKRFACTWEGCEKVFRDNYNLSVHLCTHTGEMQRACPQCRYRCVQKSAMDAHLKTHQKRQQER